MYKKAFRMKLRFQTAYGLLSVEQLWDLKPVQLAELAKKLRAEIKEENAGDDEELAFLSANPDSKQSENALRFEIVKDIYQTLRAEAMESAEARLRKENNDKILALIARKQEQELESKSIDELKQMLQ